jgi:hypothetical protein
MNVPEPPALLSRSSGVCQSDDHRHDGALVALDYLHRAGGRDGAAPSARTRPEVEKVFVALAQRWRGPAPAPTTARGERRTTLGSAAAVFSRLPPADAAVHADAGAALNAMGIRRVEDLRAFRRTVAVRAALATLRWATAPGADAAKAAKDLLTEIDAPASSIPQLRPVCPSPGSRRGRDEVVAVVDALERRRCAAGPAIVAPDGAIRRDDSDAWIGTALAGLPEHTDLDDPPLSAVLGRMGLSDAGTVRPFQRLVAVHAALAALRWTAAPPSHAASSYANLLIELDDPSAAWT